MHEIAQAGNGSKGSAIVNLLQIQKHENIAAFVDVKEFDKAHYLIMATKKGFVKKTVLSAYGNPRRGGINAINIREGDDLITAKLTDGNQEIVLGTLKGKAIRFYESDVRDMGRGATGVTGISLAKDDRVVGMVTVRPDSTLLVVTENGYGKRTAISEYRVTRRGGKGILTVNTTDKVGKMITIKEVRDDDDVMIITTAGKVIRQAVKHIRKMGRATQGIRLIRLGKNDQIGDVARIIKENNS